MPRKHTVFNAETQTQVDIAFTADEETAYDAEAVQAASDRTAENTKRSQISALEAKVDDDSITFDEMKELMRLR